MSVKYPILVSEIAVRGIRRKDIATALGVSYRTLYSKMQGDTSFSWEETCQIQATFFPDIDKDILYSQTQIPDSDADRAG